MGNIIQNKYTISYSIIKILREIFETKDFLPPLYINQKTEIPASKYIRSEDDPKRFCIYVPVIYKLQIVLDYINEFIENNLDQIITYTDRQKVFLNPINLNLYVPLDIRKVLL